MVHLIAVLAQESHDTPAIRRRIRNTVARRSARRQRVARARRSEDIKVARVRVVHALAQRCALPVLARAQRQRRQVAARAAVRQRRPVAERQAHAVEALVAAEGEGLDDGAGGEGVQRVDVAEPRPVGAAPVGALPQGRAGGPREVDVDGVVVRQRGAAGRQEPGADILERGGVEGHQRAGAVEQLVDRLAGVVPHRLRVDAGRLDRGDDAVARDLHPRVGEAIVEQRADRRVRGAGIARVGVPKDHHRVADAPRLGMGQHLVDVAVARHLVRVGGACVGVQIVNVDKRRSVVVRQPCDLHPHKGEALWREAVIVRVIAAVVPTDATKVYPRFIGERVEARANSGATGSGRTVGVGVRCVCVLSVLGMNRLLSYHRVNVYMLTEGCMVVKVLLHMDHVEVVLRKIRSNEPCVRRLVAGLPIALQDRWQSGHVQGEDAQIAACGAIGCHNCGEQQRRRGGFGERPGGHDGTVLGLEIE